MKYSNISASGELNNPADSENRFRTPLLVPNVLGGIAIWALPLALLFVGLFLVVTYPPIPSADNLRGQPDPPATMPAVVPPQGITPTLSATSAPATLPAASPTITPRAAPTATTQATATPTTTAARTPQPTATSTATATATPSPEPTAPTPPPS